MATTHPSLSIVPLERVALSTTQDEEIPDEVRRRLDPVASHALRMAEACERVVASVAIPAKLDGTEQLLTGMLDHAVQGRRIADFLSAPARTRRPVHPGPTWAAAENAAQMAFYSFRTELGASWPVTQWTHALEAVARVAAVEGAWDVLEVAADGLRADAGSLEWWDAVLYVQGLWGGRNTSPVELIAG